MAIILLATRESGSRVACFIELARDLIADGHKIIFVSDPCNAMDVKDMDVDFRPWKRAPGRKTKDPDHLQVSNWKLAQGAAIAIDRYERMIVGASALYAEDIAEILRVTHVDAVVSYEYLFGVMAAAEAFHKPLILFTATVWTLPTIDSLPSSKHGLRPAIHKGERDVQFEINRAHRGAFNDRLCDLNTAREALGLPALKDVFEQLEAADVVLLGTSRTFDFHQCMPATKFTYAGPYLSDEAFDFEEWVKPNDDSRPLILAGVSTSYQGQEDMVENIADALSGLPVTGLITLGPGIAHPKHVPGNVRVLGSASHQQILKHAKLMITHAGHGTVIRALAAGVPLICMPKGRDQYALTARALEHGAAIALDADAGPTAIASSIMEILNDTSYTNAARLIGSLIAEEVGNRMGSRIIGSLINKRRQTLPRASVGKDALEC